MVIAPTTPGTYKQLSLAEVKLYDTSGGDVSSPVFWLSSVNWNYNASWMKGKEFPASNCNDGSLSTICATASTIAGGDTNPVLRIYYSCPLGSTALSRVVVYSDTVRMDALNVFSLLFVNDANVVDRPANPFSGTQQTYTISTTSYTISTGETRLDSFQVGGWSSRNRFLSAGAAAPPPPTCHPACAPNAPNTSAHAVPSCKVVIRPTVAGVVDYLNLAEVKLYAANGAQITPFAVSMSTVYRGIYGSANVIDNNLATLGSTDDGDPSPTLTVQYDCPGGKTTAVKVVVHNRDEDCCRYRLNYFSLDIVPRDQVDLPTGAWNLQRTFRFAGSQPVYTVWAICESLLGAVMYCLLRFQTRQLPYILQPT